MQTVKVQQDFCIEKLKVIRQLLNGSRLFITDWFYLLRNDIDIKTEELLLSSESEFEASILNSTRTELLTYLTKNESECLEHHDANIKELVTQVEPLLIQLENDVQNPATRYSYLLDQLLQLEDKVKATLLLNRTSILLANRPGIADQLRKTRLIGSLVTIDRYFNELEVNLIK